MSPTQFLPMTLASLAIIVSCATPAQRSHSTLSDHDYASLIQKNTAATNQYKGLYQTFQATATLLTSEVATAELNRRGDFQQWDSEQMQKQRDRTFQEMAAVTKVFLRFFSPESEYDDLHKPQTIWKIYLEHGGKRYEGEVKKLTDKFVELKNLYPHFDRFSSPYEVTFRIPTAAVEASPAKLVLTSSLGTAEFVFPRP